MYGYIYLTTNIINNKKYIGKHKSEIFTEKYKGSGKYLWKAIDKYGIENFEVKLIEKCNSLEELNNREIYWISYYNAVDSDMFYNLASGGDGGDLITCLSEDAYNRYIRKLKESHKGDKHWVRKYNADLSGENNPIYGKLCYNNGIKDIYIDKNKIEEYESIGFHRGSHISRKGNKKISEATSKYRTGSRYMTNGKNTVVVKTDSEVEKYKLLGYKFGTSCFNRFGKNNSCYGKKKITDNGVTGIFVSVSELEQYLNNGYVLWKDRNTIMRR